MYEIFEKISQLNGMHIRCLTDFKKVPINTLTLKLDEIKKIILSNEKISSEFSVKICLDDIKDIDNLIIFLRPLFK